MRRVIASLSFAALLLLAACGGQDAASLPKPLEPDAQSVAYFCHMNLTEHDGPKGQAWVTGQDKPFWFASVGEAFTFLETEVHGGALQVVYVNDMGQGSWASPAPGAWIDIRKAVFVIGGKIPNGMEDDGPNAAPFAEKAAAQAYAAQVGGTVVDFDAAAKALAVDHAHEESHDS